MAVAFSSDDMVFMSSRGYNFQCNLGKGAYGNVCSAIRVKDGEIVAIKKIKSVFRRFTFTKRILREIQILRKLQHKNIVKIFDILLPKDTDTFEDLFIVFEYLTTDLNKCFKSSVYLELDEIREIAYNFLLSLLAVHSSHVIHRDIKLANLLITVKKAQKEGQKNITILKLADFGLSRTLSEYEYDSNSTNSPDGDTEKEKNKRSYTSTSLTESIDSRLMSMTVDTSTDTANSDGELIPPLTSHVVTRWYRPPEIILKFESYDCSVDMWSAGCIIADLLSFQRGSIYDYSKRRVLFPGWFDRQHSPLAEAAAEQMGLGYSKDQINVIFQLIGIPSADTIGDVCVADPDAQLKSLHFSRAQLYNWGGSFLEILRRKYPAADNLALDLISKLVIFRPEKRLNIVEALQHPFFKPICSIKEIKEAVRKPIVFEYPLKESKNTVQKFANSMNLLRIAILSEIYMYHDPKKAEDLLNSLKGNRESSSLQNMKEMLEQSMNRRKQRERLN